MDTRRKHSKLAYDSGSVVFLEESTSFKKYEGKDEEGEEEDFSPPSATTATISPAAGSEVAPNASLTITLDEAVDGVTVNGTAAAGSGKTWTLNLAGLNLPAAAATLNIGWTNKDGSEG